MNQYSNNNINKSIKKEISRTLQTQKKAAKQLAQDLLELKSYREKRLGEFEDFVEKIEENDYTVHLKTTSKNDSFDKVANSMNKLVQSLSRTKYEKESSKLFFIEMLNAISGAFLLIRNECVVFKNDLSIKILDRYQNKNLDIFNSFLDNIKSSDKIKILENKEFKNLKIEIIYNNEIQYLDVTKIKVNPIIASLLSENRYAYPFPTIAISTNGEPIGVNREAHNNIKKNIKNVIGSYYDYFNKDREINQKINSLTKKGKSFSFYKKNFPLYHLDTISNFQILGKIDNVDSKTALVLSFVNDQDLLLQNKKDLYQKFKEMNFSNYFFNFNPDYLYIINDNTKEIREEHLKNIAEDELVHKTKMAAIGEISTGIAHEINQPLTFISSFLQKIDFDKGKNFNANDFDDRINTALYQVSRIGSLVKDLKDIGRPETIAMGVINIFDILQSALKIFKSQLKKKKISFRLSSEINKCNIYGSKGKLEQVFINLFQNAIDSVSDITDQRQISISIHKPNRRNYIYIHFIDNGPPIPIELRHRIFEPFFSTKDTGKGTGLGLSISLGILDSHNSSIKLNEKGKKKFFIIKMPVHKE